MRLKSIFFVYIFYLFFFFSGAVSSVHAVDFIADGGFYSQIKDLFLSEVNLLPVEYIKEFFLNNVLFPSWSLNLFIIKFFSVAVLCLFLIGLWRNRFEEIYKQSKKRFLYFSIYGLSWFLFVPLIIIFLMSTIIGVPIALVLFLLYIAMFIAVKSCAVLALGYLIVEYGLMKQRPIECYPVRQLEVILYGAFFFTILVFIPYVGIIINAFALFFGAGIFLKMLR